MRLLQYETPDETDDDRNRATQETHAETIQQPRPYLGTPCTIPQVRGDLCDQMSQFDRITGSNANEMRHANQSTERMRSQENGHEYFQVGIPTFSNGLTTFAYSQALRNRITESKLRKGGEYDVDNYTPTFVHDCLMLPGTLANLLDKMSQLDIVSRMTPALLPGYRAISHCETGQACLVKSTNGSDYVQGMLIFGQGKSSRRRIREHFRPHARRTKVLVETDVKVFLPVYGRGFVGERWQLHRRRFEAHAWAQRSGQCSMHPSGCPETRLWTLENYLEGFRDDENKDLRIDPSAYEIEEDGGVSLPQCVDERLSDAPEREIVWAASGHILYDRLEEGWSGW